MFRGGPDAKVRKKLLEEFEVHTILSLPAGCFLPYTGVKTNVLFFNRPQNGGGTKSVWYYELTNDGFELKQTRKPIDGEQISEFLGSWQSRPVGLRSWCVSIDEICAKGFDLCAQNPSTQHSAELKPAIQLLQAVKAREDRISELLAELQELLEAPQ